MTHHIPRTLDLAVLTSARSLFLFGPRQTGKSTLVRKQLSDALRFDLLRSDTFLTLSRRPETLREQVIAANAEVVVIDEVQRLPQLLNEVHLLIEEHGVRFILTGSSARKLRRGGVNLLGGRARSRRLHPFTSAELGSELDLMRALNRGLLPPIYLSDDPAEDLRAYVGDYLTQEVAAEGLTRNVPAFSRFLEVAARYQGQLINYAGVASDAQVPRTTVRDYFQILWDTLLAFELPAFQRTTKRKPIKTPKLYFFDDGVAGFLQRRGRVRRRSPLIGAAFESFIFHELRAWIDYQDPSASLAYWRSKSGFEVDFVLDEHVAVEVKAKETVGTRDLRGLRALGEEPLAFQHIVVSMEERPRRVGDIDILPWRVFLRRLWDGAYRRPR